MKFIFFVLACLIFLAPSRANACSCAFSDPPTAFNGAKAVFIGRMLGGTEKFSIKDDKGITHQLEAGLTRFSIDESFKGDAVKEITISIASMRGTSCGDYGLKPGGLYLVYAFEAKQDSDGETKDNFLYSGVCTRTSEVSSDSVKEDLRFLRNLPPAGTGGNLHGRIWLDVKKVEGGSAEPLHGIKVSVHGPSGKTSVVITDKNGEFVVNRIKSGRYRVQPQLPENLYIEDDFEEVDVADLGTAAVGFEAYYKGEVTGRVLDKDGVGFNSAFLHILSIDTGKNQRHVYGHSDGENGNFSFDGVPPGQYVLFLELKHKDYDKHQKYYYPGTYDRKNAKVFDVRFGEKVEKIDFTLPYDFRVRTVEGQVVRNDGKPAGDVEVMLLCPQAQAQMATQ